MPIFSEKVLFQYSDPESSAAVRNLGRFKNKKEQAIGKKALLLNCLLSQCRAKKKFSFKCRTKQMRDVPNEVRQERK